MLIQIILAIGISIIFTIIILSMIEKKIKIKIENEKNIQRSEIYKEQLKDIVNSDGNKEEIVESIDLLKKRFFEEFYPSQKKMDYSDLLEAFKRENNKEGAEFSELMLKSYYDPEEITNERIDSIARKFNLLIDENTKEIKKEQERSKVKQKISEKENSKEKIMKNKLHPLINELNKNTKIIYESLSILSKNTIFLEMTEEKLKSKSANQLIGRDKEAFNEVKTVLNLLNKNNSIINQIIREIYSYSEKEEREKIKNLIENWKNEKINILEKTKNPVELGILEQNLASEKFQILKKLIKKSSK